MRKLVSLGAVLLFLCPVWLQGAERQAPSVPKAQNPFDSNACSRQIAEAGIGQGSSETQEKFPAPLDLVEDTCCTEYCNVVCAPWPGYQASACTISPAPPHHCHSICCCETYEFECAAWYGQWP
jgi:hypothetical protein